ncbi:MAG: diguanylate cyclase, partial [Sphaerochaetaceae bacterium]|nr:diguanylate cyclase [Sphaerochaetaceae bacterium]
MKKDIKKDIRTHFNLSYQQLNSFDNIFKDKNQIILENYKRQNNYALFIASVLLMSLNIAWIAMSILIKNIRHNTSTFGTIGILCTTIASAYMIYFIASKRYKKTKNYELSVLAFHTLIYLSSMFLSYSYYIATNNSKGLGISMSALLLLICVVIPLSNKKYSSISLSLMAITTIVPAFLCKAGLHQYIVRFGLLFIMSVAFLAFSRITKTSSKVIADLSDVSFKDFQTQTLNRRALSEYLNKIPNKDILNIGLMVFDIDNFKKYNDEYSHTMGDEALTRICNAAKAILDDNSLIFRYGSGEFIIIIENTTDQNLLVTALKLRDAVEQLNIEMKQSNWRKYLTVTIGCTSATKSEFIKHDMLSEADSQLAIGKHGTKNCVVFKGKIFVAEGEISIEQQPTVYTERVNHAITEAMKSHDLRAYYQPMYDTVTHKLVGAEALSRWIKPDGTVILPGEFIPELEKNSSIIAIDWY